MADFKGKANITEYYLPADGPNFCTGCTNCFLNGENTCKDADKVSVIEKSLLEADLIVMTSPAYVMHTTGAMKTLLDHFGYRWMPHRPAPEMFSKRAVIITQCLGAGAKSTAKDIKHSLSWWGISEISVIAGSLMGALCGIDGVLNCQCAVCAAGLLPVPFIFPIKAGLTKKPVHPARVLVRPER